MRGQVLLDMVHPDDRGRVVGPDEEPPRVATSWCHLRLRSPAGWTEGCILVAPSQLFAERIGFALIGAPRPNAGLVDRVAELERRLRHIAAEVRAAGALETVGEMPSPGDVRELGQLSSRQWEIVSRLLNGQRVGAIAEALFVSPSTVRNHLSTIFRKFGVHSQSDLLERLRRGDRRGGL
jgi:DNA-binding CsgD family transcriptional regulator